MTQALLKQMEDLKREQRNQALWRTLKEFIIPSNIPKYERSLIIVNLACGDCEEGHVLNAFFSTGIYGYPDTRSHVIGIDIREENIQRARKLQIASETNSYRVLPSITLKVGSGVIEIKNMDVLFIRHPHVKEDLFGTPHWFDLLKEATQKLSPSGIGMITSFIEDEHAMILDYLLRLGVTILSARENPHQIPLNHEKPIAGDKWIVVFKK